MEQGAAKHYVPFGSGKNGGGISRSFAQRLLRRGNRRDRQETTSLRHEMTSLFGVILPLIDTKEAIVLHVTAAVSGEGTTTIARGLAAAAGRREQCSVLLLEMEPARASAGAGGATALEQMASGGSVVPDQRLIDGVSVPFSMLMRSANDAAKPQDIRALYDWARRNYTLTIVDCPPVLGASEIAAMSRIADGTLLVVNADDTRVAVVQSARDSLESAGANIIGVALNRRQNFIPPQLYRFL